jgi:hypothetical protein
MPQLMCLFEMINGRTWLSWEWSHVHAGFLLGWFLILKMKAIPSPETSVHIRTTRRYIPEDGSIRNYCRKNNKS